MPGVIAWVVVLVLLLALCVGAVGASPTGVGDVQRRTLANGLEILVQENHSAPLVCSYIWYRVGLRNEGKGESGLTHFLEHMAFKGSESYSGREVDRLVTMRGGYLNGFTSMEYTAYVETLPRDALDLAFRIESDRMANCLLRAEDVESEKGVVISEFEGAENDPSFLLRRAVMEAQFPDQPYGRTVIGSKDDLRGLTQETMASYYRRHYAPNNAVLVVVGDVAAEDVFAMAEGHFGGIARAEVSGPTSNPGRGATGEKRVNLALPGRTSYIQMVYEVPPVQHADHIVLEVLQNVLSGGRTSRLYRALVDTGLASQAGGWDYENPDPTVFAFEVALNPGVEHERAEKVLDAVIEEMKTNAVGERELTKAKNQTTAHFVYAADGVTKLAQQLGYYEIVVGEDYLRTFTDRVDAVTAEDIQRVAQQYFTVENRTVGRLTATNDAEAAGRSPGGASPTDLRWHYRPDGPQATGSAGVPDPIAVPSGLGIVPAIRHYKLANGLEVILEEDHAAPFVTVYGNVMAGPVFDPPHKVGLATFTAEMLSRGTRKRSWGEIQEALDFVAAQLGFSTGAQVGTFAGQCLKGDLGLLLDAAAEQLIEPAFPPEEIEKVRAQVIAAQERRDEDTFQIAEKTLFSHLYPVGHPLNSSDLGTPETVARISRESLLAFHSTYYRPENTILAIVGDIDPAEVAALLDRAFGGWQRLGRPTRPRLPQVAVPAKPRTLRVLVPNKTQVDIAIGFPGISRRDPRYYQADLANYVLGRGGFMSRMTMHIREELGLAYYVWTNYYAYWGPGPWVLHMGVNPANADKALAAALEELKRIQEEPPSEEELQLWKDYVEGTVARRMETFSGIAQNLVLSAFYELGLYHTYEYPSILRAITPEEVMEAARATLHPEGYVAVIAGPVAGAEGGGGDD